MDKLNEEVRLIIAFTVTIIIILVFGKMQGRHSEISKQTSLPSSESTTEETVIYHEKQVIEKPSDIPLLESEQKTYEDSMYVIVIDTISGSIKKLGIKKYQRKNEPFFTVLENSQLLLDSTKDGIHPEYKISSWDEKSSLITFIGHIGKNIYAEKSISIPSDSHTFQSSITLVNKDANRTFFTYIIQAGRVNLHQPVNRNEISPPELLIKTNGQILKLNPSRIKQDTFYENTQWIALKQRYTLLMLKTKEETKSFVVRENNFVNFGFMYETINMESNGHKNINLSFYAGPSDYFIARNEIDDKKLFGSGFFASMGRFLFTLLSYIHRVIPIWGWAIIILTLIIKVLFFPLTKNSLKSMKTLQKLRPYLQEIQKKYKDNPQQMQKEMMNLYKDYKINPFGGCIPMLIQFPIFIGFFIALRSSIFFRGAPFCLWINDLSLPDTIAQVGNFNINLLPLLMAITSFWQQKLTPQEPSQKAMTYMMPAIFLLLFYNFSSGLLLYWVTMNAAGLIEQYFIYKK